MPPGLREKNVKRDNGKSGGSKKAMPLFSLFPGKEERKKE